MKGAHMINPELLWDGGKNAPLVFLIPGGTGTRRPTFRGYESTASYFWLHGFSCYIDETAGQDGREGVFSMERCLDESREKLSQLQTLLSPSRTILFASCSGGTIAAYLAAEFQNVHSLILWETMPRYLPLVREWFMGRAKDSGVSLSENFLGEYIETADVTSKVRCPVLVMYGDGSDPVVVTEEEVKIVAESLTHAKSVELFKISGADHNVPRGSSAKLLNDLLEKAMLFIQQVDTFREAPLS